MSYTNDVLDYYGIQKKNDDELMHYAKGQTKKGAKYLRRLFKKGKWIYEYPITGKGYKKQQRRYGIYEKMYNDLSNYNQNIRIPNAQVTNDNDLLSYGFMRLARRDDKNVWAPYQLDYLKSRSDLVIAKANQVKYKNLKDKAAIGRRMATNNYDSSLSGFIKNVLEDISIDVYNLTRSRPKVNWP